MYTFSKYLFIVWHFYFLKIIRFYIINYRTYKIVLFKFVVKNKLFQAKSVYIKVKLKKKIVFII